MKRHQHGGNTRLMAERYGLKAGELIDFSVNLNPLGPPPELAGSFKENLAALTVYPEPDSRSLREAGADWLCVEPEQLIFANGAVELIYLLIYWLRPRLTLIPAPTFADYGEAVHLAGLRVKHLRLSYLGGFCPTGRCLARGAKGVQLAFLCNPNNPTGNLIPDQVLRGFLAYCSEKGIILVIDESFLPFHPEWKRLSLIPETAAHSNLLVLQSLTKIFAIPGLRVGCAVGHPQLISALREKQPPWQVNGLAQVLTPLCFRAEGYLKRTVDYLTEERRWLGDALAALPGLRVFPSESAYYLLRVKAPLRGSVLARQLARRGIIVREAGNFAFLDESYLRVAVKKREQNEILLRNLRELLVNYHYSEVMTT